MRRVLRYLFPWSISERTERVSKLVTVIAVGCRRHMDPMLEDAPRHTSALQLSSLVECVGLAVHLCRRAAHVKGSLARVDRALSPALEQVVGGLALSYMKEASDAEFNEFRAVFHARMTECEGLYTMLEIKARREGRDPMIADVDELMRRVEACYGMRADDTLKGIASLGVVHALGAASAI